MKVLHLSAEKTWRGGEQQIAYLIEESLALGLQIHVACQTDSPFEAHCIRHSIPHSSLSFRKFAGLTAARALKKICRTFGISLIHAHSSIAHSAAVLSASLGNPTPIIISRKVVIPLKRKITTRWKYNHPSIKKIICVSDAVSQIVRASITDHQKLATVHDGIDLTRFQNIPRSRKIRDEFQISPDQKLIINIAALGHDKDLFTFLRTAKRVIEKTLKSSQSVHFLIAGSGPLREQLDSEIHRLGLTDHVTLAGFRQDIPELLQEADLFFTSSRSEGLGSSILDALASRKAVIATAAGGIPELIEDHKTGLLAPIGDDHALSAAILHLLEHPRLAQQLAENGYLRVEQQFQKRNMATKTISQYREVLQVDA